MDNSEIIARLRDSESLENTRYNMEVDYQRYILALMVSDRQFLMESVDLIRPTFFTDDVHRTLARIIVDYYDEHKKLPATFIMRQAVRDRIQDSTRIIKTLGELDALYEYYVPGLDARDAVQNKILKFAKTQALRQAFQKSFELLSKDFESDEHWTKIEEFYKEAITVDRTYDMGLDYFGQIEERYALMEEMMADKEKLSTGIEFIDNTLTGGTPSRGEVISVMGLPGTGKSLALVAGAIKNMGLGHKVAYLSCEMNREKVAERFDAQLSGESISTLYDNKNLVIVSLKDHAKELDDPRQLIIQHFPAGSADINTFRSYHARLNMMGFIPDVVIIDYVGEMKDAPGIKTYESRFRIVRDLRGWATEDNFLGLTAMQPNRAARELEKGEDALNSYIDDDNLADAYGQTRPLDMLWSINQTTQEKNADIARGFIVKSRNGKSRVPFYIGFNPRTLAMGEISHELYRTKLSTSVDSAATRTAERFDDLTGLDRGKKDKKKKDDNDNDPNNHTGDENE